VKACRALVKKVYAGGVYICVSIYIYIYIDIATCLYPKQNPALWTCTETIVPVSTFSCPNATGGDLLRSLDIVYLDIVYQSPLLYFKCNEVVIFCDIECISFVYLMY
jgi:hypothetical protein